MKTKSEQDHRLNAMNAETLTLKSKLQHMETSLLQAQQEASNSLSEVESLKDSLGSNYEQLTEALEEVKASDERCKNLSTSNQALAIEFDSCRVKFDQDRSEFRAVK